MTDTPETPAEVQLDPRLRPLPVDFTAAINTHGPEPVALLTFCTGAGPQTYWYVESDLEALIGSLRLTLDALRSPAGRLVRPTLAVARGVPVGGHPIVPPAHHSTRGN